MSSSGCFIARGFFLPSRLPQEILVSELDVPDVIQLSPRKFLLGCVVMASTCFILGRLHWTSSAWIALQLTLTILGLFLLGSFRYQLDKNALTYGMGGVIMATFIPLWWPGSVLKASLADHGFSAVIGFVRVHLLTLHGLEDLIHADTMLFILGLTYFVSVIAQTRLLETASTAILKQQRGYVLPTVALLVGIVALCSGGLGGVSMIGLLIRTLVIILTLGRAETRDIIFAVVVSTVITTVSGMFMAYGEPPNLIMKANLEPNLDNLFFIRYGLPIAFGSYLIVAWNLRLRLRKRKIDLKTQDILDTHNADVRFLQASRHGEVFTPLEFVESQQDLLEKHYIPVHERVLEGEPLGQALIREEVPLVIRKQLLGHFVSEDLSQVLEDHYQAVIHRQHSSEHAETEIRRAIEGISLERRHAQMIGLVAFIPFIVLLILHGFFEAIPLFFTSMVGFVVAYAGIYGIPKMRKLILREAWQEYKEYLFLFPLFIGITLLQKTGFFDVMAHLLKEGIAQYGISHMAYVQYWGACILSAILDNNIVADFASQALHGLSKGTIHLFSMAQIAGYAVGGCWTHIGCAQSVVAYAFIRKEISPRYTPVQWMKSMTMIILEMSAFITAVVYFEGWLLGH